ncbi:hypothetical protein AB0N60_36305 [Streptomyces microflavus]|uniref:hypothetical protein n=1 Tax=Streptomyces microflavus TaxID=1919 RepID=UPI00341E682D
MLGSAEPLPRAVSDGSVGVKLSLGDTIILVFLLCVCVAVLALVALIYFKALERFGCFGCLTILIVGSLISAVATVVIMENS